MIFMTSDSLHYSAAILQCVVKKYFPRNRFLWISAESKNFLNADQLEIAEHNHLHIRYPVQGSLGK